jgi:type 1 glutamine amidotransferase
MIPDMTAAAGAAPRASTVLVFTRTTAYRHASIPAGRAALTRIAAGLGLTAHATEDPDVFRGPSLARCAAVVFLSTSGDVLDPAGQAALEGYVGEGGAFLGIHSAACTEYDWPFFGELVGARFARHPAFQAAVLGIEDQGHPATAHLPKQWELSDEWYDFRANPRGGVHVLASVDESTYVDGGMGADHPIAWWHQVGRGRSFYTALGHASEAFDDPLFLGHLQGALSWLVAGPGQE